VEKRKRCAARGGGGCGGLEWVWVRVGGGSGWAREGGEVYARLYICVENNTTLGQTFEKHIFIISSTTIVSSRVCPCLYPPGCVLVCILQGVSLSVSSRLWACVKINTTRGKRLKSKFLFTSSTTIVPSTGCRLVGGKEEVYPRACMLV
jgi:hypothetical protein